MKSVVAWLRTDSLKKWKATCLLYFFFAVSHELKYTVLYMTDVYSAVHDKFTAMPLVTHHSSLITPELGYHVQQAEASE
jgi:hypothetical protein